MYIMYMYEWIEIRDNVFLLIPAKKGACPTQSSIVRASPTRFGNYKKMCHLCMFFPLYHLILLLILKIYNQSYRQFFFRTFICLRNKMFKQVPFLVV